MIIDITDVIGEYIEYDFNGIAILPDDEDYLLSFYCTNLCHPPYVCIRVKEDECCEERVCCKVGPTGPRGLRGPRGIQGITGPTLVGVAQYELN